MDGRARGIDISHNDGVLDWSSLSQPGFDFVIAKASQGVSFADPQFGANWRGIGDAGLVRGAYHMIGYVDPTQASWQDVVHAQVDRFLGLVGPLQSGDLPPALDLEDLDSPTKWAALIQNDLSAAVAVVHEYITYITAGLNGVLPILYTGSFWWSELRDPDADTMPFSNYPLWFAQYPMATMPGPDGPSLREMGSFDEYDAQLAGKHPNHIPAVWGGPADPTWSIWQFSEKGRLPGFVSTFVDLDVFNGTVDDLKALCIR